MKNAYRILVTESDRKRPCEAGLYFLLFLKFAFWPHFTSFIHSFIQLSTRSFIHSFIHYYLYVLSMLCNNCILGTCKSISAFQTIN